MPENNLVTLTLNKDEANKIPCPSGVNRNGVPRNEMALIFANRIFKFIFFYEKCAIVFLISRLFVPSGQINKKTALVRMVTWR